MLQWRRILPLGFLGWLIPFAVVPLKRTNAALFENIMTLVVLLTAGVPLSACFRRRHLRPAAKLAVASLWTAMNLTETRGREAGA